MYFINRVPVRFDCGHHGFYTGLSPKTVCDACSARIRERKRERKAAAAAAARAQKAAAQAAEPGAWIEMRDMSEGADEGSSPPKREKESIDWLGLAF